MPNTKQCPYCAELVNEEAIRCKHCHANISEKPEHRPDLPTHIDGDVGLRAGFGKRLLAFVADVLLLFVLAILLGPLFGGLLGKGVSQAANGISEGGGMAVGAYAGLILGFPLFSVLFGLLEMFFGRTPGKFVTGLVIAKSTAVRSELGRLVGRAMIKNMPLYLGLYTSWMGADKSLSSLLTPIFSIVFFVGCFMVLGEKRQALHDRLAGTAVYRRRDLKEQANI